MIDWLYTGPLSPIRDLASEVDGYPEILAGRVVRVELGDGGRYARIELRGKDGVPRMRREANEARREAALVLGRPAS